MKKTLLFAAGLLLSAGSLWAEVPEGIVVTPTPGTVTEEISEIEINVKGLFPEGSYGIYYATVTYNSLSITSNNGYKAENVPLEVVNQTEGTVKVTLENPISGTENGTYTVTTNFESFKYYGESNAQTPVPNFEFNYVVGTGEGGGSGDDPDNPGDDTVEYMDPPKGYNIPTNGQGVGMPGEVKQILGFIDLYLKNVYSSVTGFNANLKAFVINAQGEKVGNTDGYGVADYLDSEDLDVAFTVNPAIKEAGEYYFVFPFAGCKATPIGGGDEITMKDMKIGPYIVEQVDPVPAEATFSPEGTVYENSLPTAIQLTITNSKSITYKPFDNCTLTGPTGAITLQNGHLSSNSIVWNLPEDWSSQGVGEYTVTITTPILAGTAEDDAPLSFPEDPYTWKFTVAEAVPVLPTVEIGGEAVTADTYSFTEGTSVEVTLTTTSGDIYYKWGSADFEKYTTPLSINEAGDLVYYAKLGNKETAQKTLTFEMTEAPLPSQVKTITPQPGTYDEWTATQISIELTTYITSNEDNAKVTITNPEGETTDVTGITVTNYNTVNIPTDGIFTVAGKYVVAVDLTKCGYMANGITTPFNLKYTLNIEEPTPVEIPDVVIGSEAVSEDTYEIEEGKSVTVTLDGGEGVDVYYKWTAAKADTPATGIEETTDWTLYTDPLEIDGAGDLSYYAEKDGVKSEEKTLSFTVKEAEVGTLPAGIASIEPAPGTYKVWEENTEIVFTIDGAALLGTWAADDKSVTVTNPSGEEQTFAATSVAGSMTKFKFNTGDFFKEKGKYIVAVNVSAFNLVISTDPMETTHIAPFTIEYTLDVSTGVAGVGADGEDAEYYDLNGRRLKGELVPGIYVKNVNGKVSKVIVK